MQTQQQSICSCINILRTILASLHHHQLIDQSQDRETIYVHLEAPYGSAAAAVIYAEPEDRKT